MQQQRNHAADEFAFFASAHALDFLGDIDEVGLGKLAGAQKRRLLMAPGVEIPIVEF